jgi:hypothetical protein
VRQTHEQNSNNEDCTAWILVSTTVRLIGASCFKAVQIYTSLIPSTRNK